LAKGFSYLFSALIRPFAKKTTFFYSEALDFVIQTFSHRFGLEIDLMI